MTTRITNRLGRVAAIALLAGTAACQQSQTASNAPQANMAGASGAKPVGSAAPAAPGPGKPTGNVASAAPIAIPVPQASLSAPANPGATADAADRRVRIVNNSGQVITMIRGSPSNGGAWGDDRIPTSVLSVGDSVMIDFDDGNGECVYDLQATLADGSVRVSLGSNVCQISEWAVSASD